MLRCIAQLRSIIDIWCGDLDKHKSHGVNVHLRGFSAQGYIAFLRKFSLHYMTHASIQFAELTTVQHFLI